MSNCPICKLPQSATEYCVTVEDMCYRYESVFIKPEELNA